MPVLTLDLLVQGVAAVTEDQRKRGVIGWTVAWSPDLLEWFNKNGIEPGDHWGFQRGHWFDADHAAEAEHSTSPGNARLNKWQRDRRPGEVGGPAFRNGWSLSSNLADTEKRASLTDWRRVY